MKCSLRLFTAFSNYESLFSIIEEKVKTRSARIKSRTPRRKTREEKRYGSEENNGENPDDRKWTADGTKQIKTGHEVCGSPWVPIL
ncbi:hypothetical protein T4D_7568 [Trichinella pseudospiralis]|uniref:Uncharacterized protein n=1 Tax=Trichinella pseudospiralis TaxID=6337 RepID=A0A0V1FVA4_TRIPS|nr:hypothetical protein T4D_7568 [Trichinella pseudospiralis]